VAQLGAGFGSSYPSSIDTIQTYRNTDSAAPDSDTRLDAEFCNDVLMALRQLETALGASVNGAYSSLAARLEALILQGGGVETGGSTALSNVVPFAVPMQIVIPGLAHQQAAPALLYQVYDTATPPNAIQPTSVSVHPTTFDVVMTFATSQVGTAMVANPLPSVLIPFTNEVNLVIPGTTHGLAQTFLLFQVYDTQIPAQAIQPQNFSVNPTSKDVTLTFAFPQSGSIRLSAGSPRYTQTFGALTTWTIPASTHGLGSANLLWQCYDASANPQAIQPQGLSVSATGDVLVTFAFAQAGSIVLVPVPFVPPSLASKPLSISVGVTGARGDGVTNDSPAVQAAINRAITDGIRHVVFPPGSYLLNTPVTIQNTSLQMSGAGMDVTKLLVNNATGGLVFLSTGVTGTIGSAHHLWLHDLTFVASGSGALNRGAAVRATWPATSAVPATPHLTATNIGIRSSGYDSATASNPFFAKGFHITNAHDVRLSDIHIIQINNFLGEMIHFDYAHNADAFRATARGIEIIGGRIGIYVTGWLENIQLSELEIVGQNYPIYLDSSAAVSDIRNPAAFITNGHLNGSIQTIAVLNFADIHLSDLSLYTVNYTASSVRDIVFLQDCQEVTITNCKLGFGPNASSTLMHGVRLVNQYKFTISNNVFVLNHDVSATVQMGVLIGAGSQLGLVSDNVFMLTGFVPNTRGILMQASVVNTDQVSLLGNRFENIENGIVGVDTYNLLIADNVLIGTGTPVTLSGAIGSQVIVRGNHPAQRITLPINIQAPVVSGAPDGLVIANNSSATTITNFQGFYDGMVLEVYAANGNTIVQHNANIFLQGSVNVALTPGSLLVLRYTLGAWREIGRTIL
jgi:Pectate lyase superfamily protein/Periplasmic copper-binding protein (NosD)